MILPGRTGVRFGAIAFFALGSILAGSFGELGYAWDKRHPPPLPQFYDEMIGRNQFTNISGRPTLSEKEARIQPVFHWDVPVERVEETISRHIDRDTLDFVHVTGTRIVKGKAVKADYVRFFAVKGDRVNYNAMIANFGEPKPVIYWGTRLQSHATYFVWNPDDSKADPYFVKMAARPERTSPVLPDSECHNGCSVASASVLASDFMEDSGYRSNQGSFFPERYASSALGPHGSVYSQTVRLARPRYWPQPRGRFFSAFSVLSPDHFATFVRASGLSRKRWLQEYLDALARFHAEQNIRGDFQIAGHTQNIVLEIGANGRVLRVHSWDALDTLVDPIGVALSAPGRLVAEKMPTGGVMNEQWPDPDAENGFKPGLNFGYYSAQAIDSIPNLSPRQSAGLAGHFLKAYVKEAERLIGEPIRLSTQSKRILSAFAKLPDDPAKVSALFTQTDEIHWAGNVRRGLAEVMQDVYEKRIQIQFRQAKETMRFDPHFQWELSFSFWHKKENHRNSPNGALEGRRPSDFLYAWKNHCIWAVDRKSGELAGILYLLGDSRVAYLDNVAKRLGFIECVDLGI